MRHAHTRATAVPADLVEAQARANSACEKVWREARGRSDFAPVWPYLVEVVSLVRQHADAMAPALGLSPYDALMDGYQRGIGAADVAPVFARYEAFLRDALPRAEERQARSLRPCRAAGRVPRGPAGGPVPPLVRPRRAGSRDTRGSTAPPTRSAAAPPPTCGSPRATTRPTRPRR